MNHEGSGAVSRIQHGVSALIHNVVGVAGATAEIGGEIAAGTIKVAGRGIRGFARRLFRS